MAVEYRISKFAGGIAIGIAIIIDIIQFFLAGFVIGGVLNTFLINPIAFLSFWTWFLIKGVKISDRKNATMVAIGTLVEMIPYINIVPALTLMVIKIVINTRVDDLIKSQGKLGKVAQKGISAAEANYPKRPPQNISGSETSKPEPTNLASAPDPYREAA